MRAEKSTVRNSGKARAASEAAWNRVHDRNARKAARDVAEGPRHGR